MLKCPLYIFFLFGILLISNSANGQNDDYVQGGSRIKSKETHPEINDSVKSPFILKSNPFAMLLAPIPIAAEYRIGCEFTVTRKQSFQLYVSYLGKGLFLKLIEADTSFNNTNYQYHFLVHGARIQLSYKYYILPQHSGVEGEMLPYGLYTGPHFSYSYAELHEKDTPDYFLSFQHTNIAAMLGYNIDLGSNFNFDSFFGLGIKWDIWQEHDLSTHNTITFPKSDMGIYGSPLKMYLGFNFGYAF